MTKNVLTLDLVAPWQEHLTLHLEMWLTRWRESIISATNELNSHFLTWTFVLPCTWLKTIPRSCPLDTHVHFPLTRVLARYNIEQSRAETTPVMVQLAEKWSVWLTVCMVIWVSTSLRWHSTPTYTLQCLPFPSLNIDICQSISFTGYVTRVQSSPHFQRMYERVYGLSGPSHNWRKNWTR